MSGQSWQGKDELSQAARALLERRAERLGMPETSVKEESVLWVAEFPIADEQYAIPLASLRAAVPLRMVTPVPLSPTHVVGVLRFQGKIISALSLASLLGGRGWREDPAVLLVVEPSWGQLVALDCEQTPRPTALPLAAVEQSRRNEGEAVLEVTTRDLRQVNLIQIDQLLNRRREVRRAN